MNSKKKILIGSPISQKPAILKEFLASLDRLEMSTFTCDYFFVDDYNVEESAKLLQAFSSKHSPNCTIYKPEKKGEKDFICNDEKHHWDESHIWRVAEFKNKMLAQGKEKGYDYVFLIDSDLVLHPKTLESLISAGKDIVANIFWTLWPGVTVPQPNVWVANQYNLYKTYRYNELLSRAEVSKREGEFLNPLKMPGVYEVGGLGACTLISQNALQKGVNFNNIYNVTLWGEDRFFCIRAIALGLSLFVDTHYPAYHIYRESDLRGVEDYIRKTNEN